jgi:hypothetical protein
MRDFLRNSPSTGIDTCIENLTVLHGTFEWGNSQRIVAILPGVFGGPTAKLPSCQTECPGAVAWSDDLLPLEYPPIRSFVSPWMLLMDPFH